MTGLSRPLRVSLLAFPDAVVSTLTGTSDARREAIARAARARVMVEHTGVVRARELAARIAAIRQSRTAPERIEGTLTESAA